MEDFFLFIVCLTISDGKVLASRTFFEVAFKLVIVRTTCLFNVGMNNLKSSEKYISLKSN